MNCTRDGVVLERSWSEWKHAAPTFKKSTPHSIQNHTAHTLIVSIAVMTDLFQNQLLLK